MEACYTHTIPGRSGSAGTVLLLVLILSAAMYLVAGTLLLITTAEVQIANFEQRATQAFCAAESSLTLGVSLLRDEPDYRADKQAVMTIGNNPAMLSVTFYEGIEDGGGVYRPSLAPSLYRLILRGTGTVSGLNAAAHRTLEREVVIKPFALYARDSLTLVGNCTMTGHLHANDTLTLGSGATVVGNATSTRPVNADTGATVSGVMSTESALEPAIAFPELAVDRYWPHYTYEGARYAAEPLSVTFSVALTAEEGEELPGTVIDVYRAAPHEENPAGVFVLDEVIDDASANTLTALEVEGTVIIPASAQVALRGAVTIRPVEHFPAIVSANDLSLTLLGNLGQFFDAPYPSWISSSLEQMIYVNGVFTLTAEEITDTLIEGSVFSQASSLTGLPRLKMAYDSEVFTEPPPGLHLIELGAWREVF
jgi:hypothetical protein